MPVQFELPLPAVKTPASTGSKTISQYRTLTRWSLTAVVISAAVVGATMMLFGRRHPQAPSPSHADDQAAVAGASADPSVIPETTIAPTWAGRRRATWARDGSKTIAFELQAIDDVPIWMGRARPALVVRCLHHKTEVFVAPGSAASIEPRADSHTVHLRIDDDEEVVQQWSDSESGQELFAPDGMALARRLARARRMRFGLTPYNAKAVTAEFLVEGFDQLAGLVAKTCAWRADDPGSAGTRSVRLK
jgi:Type VI secretion system VasI, EvfG, VC_A0118